VNRYASIFISMLIGLGCPADDEDEDTGADDGSGEDPTDPEAGTAPEDSSGGDDAAALGCAADLPEDAMDGTVTGIMGKWGSPCETDADCIPVIGEGGVCLFTAVIYSLPQGYCSKSCPLPEGVTYVADDPTCDPAGGVSCIGNTDVGFNYCDVPCTENAECERAGYYCRLLPQLGAEGDPMFCLMPDCCQEEGAPGEGCLVE
jgi:hypothetical protein